jgi:hypothetical protein
MSVHEWVSALLRGVERKLSGSGHPVVRGASRCKSMMGSSTRFGLLNRIEMKRAVQMPLPFRNTSTASCRRFSNTAMIRSRLSAGIAPPHQRGGRSCSLLVARCPLLVARCPAIGARIGEAPYARVVGPLDRDQCSAGHRMTVAEATTESADPRGRAGSGLGLWAHQARLNRQTARSVALFGPCAIR